MQNEGTVEAYHHVGYISIRNPRNPFACSQIALQQSCKDPR